MNPDIKTRILLPVVIASLAACSSGSSSDPDEQVGAEQIITVGEEPASVETQGRVVAIDMLELVDTIDYVGTTLLPTVDTIPAGTQACADGGETARTEAGGLRTVQWSDCKLSENSELVLSGSVASDESATAENTSHEFNELTLTNGNRRVIVSGNLDTGPDQLTSESLVVNEGTGDYSITSLQYQKSMEGSLSTIVLSATVNIARLSANVALSVDPSLQWTESGCPTSGSLEISPSNSVGITVEAAGGENLLYTQGEITDTIACTEVNTLVGGSGAAVFLPPLPPN